MTRLTLLRQLLATPRDHADQGRIGLRRIYPTPDGREKLTLVFRVLRSVVRRAA